jgi:RNA recognition motif-containing protein
MDKYDLSGEGYGSEGILSVLEYQGKKVQTSTAKKPFNNIYVKNFPKDLSFTDDSLVDLFKEYGNVQSASIMRDENGDSKGFGFVCFDDTTAAESAIAALKEKAGEDDGEAKDDEERAAQKLFACEAKKK